MGSAKISPLSTSLWITPIFHQKSPTRFAEEPKIKAWQLADDVTVEIYNITRAFPREEMYGLVSQLRRAICSVPGNIVEGAARSHKKEYLHFLDIARGSLAEADYFLHLANRLDYLGGENYNKISQKLDELGATLYGLIKAVKKEV